MTTRPDLDRAAAELEITRRDSESTDAFAVRVAEAYLLDGGDAYHALELLTGRQHDEVDFGAKFTLVHAQAALEKARYSRTRDTYFNMPWDEFLAVPETGGFTFVGESPNPQKYGGQDEVKRTYIHTGLGAALHAQSYPRVDTTTDKPILVPRGIMSNAYLVYEVCANEARWDTDELYRMGTLTARHGSGRWHFADGNMIWYACADVRVGLKELVTQLDATNRTFNIINNPWQYATASQRKHYRALSKEFKVPELAALVSRKKR